MLARTADNLFWMARYTERAQNIARMVEVASRLAMTPSAGDGHREQWRSTLVSVGCEAAYFEKYDELESDKVIDFLLLDKDNPSSVRGCLGAARSTAKAVRTATTREMWECVNSTWLEIADITTDKIRREVLPQFLQWVLQRSALFQGSLIGTILRNDSYFFCQAGTYLERADNTARILDVKYHVLLPNKAMVGGGIDRSQWATILRSVSALRAYKWVYRKDYSATDVADFLILRKEMPRSIAHCYASINESMRGLANYYGNDTQCQQMTEDAAFALNAMDIDTIIRNGLHEFLQERIAWSGEFAQCLANEYNFAQAA